MNLCGPAVMSYQTDRLISWTLMIVKKKSGRRRKTRKSLTLTISAKATVNDVLTIIILKVEMRQLKKDNYVLLFIKT